jgi:HlyD family secretion protein
MIRPARPSLVLAILILFAGCRRPEPAKTELAAALTVELVSPRRDDWPQRVPASGALEAWEESIIGAEIGGLKLAEVLVNVGDVVTKGQLLARFTDENVRMDLAQAEAAVAEAEANLVLSQDQAQRARELNAGNAMSRQDLLNLETNEKKNAAKLSSTRAQLETQRLRLKYTRVVAPDDGVISSRTATMGTVSTAGAQLFRLIRQGRLEWRAEVNAEALAAVRIGQDAEIGLSDGSRIRGKVRQLSPVVSTATRSGVIYVDLEQTEGLKAGMFVAGELLLPSRPALHVPEGAIVYRDGFQYVMKVGADHRIRQIKVTTGRRDRSGLEITHGVSEGDQLVSSGGSFLNEGDAVRIAGVAMQP